MPRTRRTVIDGGFEFGGQSWSLSESQSSFFPGVQHFGLVLGFTIDFGGQASFDSVTLWSTGLLSFGPATQAQIDFVASGASPFPDAVGGNPGFPGNFIVISFNGQEYSNFDFAIGVVDYLPEYNLSEAVPTAFFGLGGAQIILDEQGFTILDVQTNAGFGAGIFAGSIPETAGSGPGSGEALERTWADAFWFTLQGTSGPDTLSGSVYNETLEGGDGTDTALFHGISASYRFGLSADGYITVQGPPAADGRDALRDIETFAFSDRSFTVLAGDGTLPPSIGGTEGDDRIDLSAPGDLQASGGNGNDTYLVDSPGDRIEESADAVLGGQDTVISSASRTLGSYLENLVLTGAGAIRGIGNARANVITGSVADNTLSGNGGADSLSGGDGNDNLIGGTGNDTLQGDAGNDTLTGSGGRDLLVGGDGSDLYIVDALDTVFELPGSGIDTMQGAVTLRAPDDVENLVLTGTGRVGATGNILPNRISGNVAANLLSGAGGNDTLIGNGGDDTLSGGAGKDILTGGAGKDAFRFASALSALTNVDTVMDFVHGDDLIVLDTRIFTTLDAIAGFGPEQFLSAPGAIRAADASHRIIYNTTTGALFYDPDGAGGVDAIRFATIGTSTHPTLDASDFLLI